MKNYYTQEELKNISDEELLELSCFGGNDSTYYYSNIKNVAKTGEEYSITFKDSSTIYTQNEKKYNEIVKNKARYDLLSKSLAVVEADNDRMDSFLEKVQTSVDEKLKVMLDKVLITQDIIKENVDNITANNINFIKESNKESSDIISKISKSVDIQSKEWSTKLLELKDFDVNSYNLKMKKLEKIIDSFSELLEE